MKLTLLCSMEEYNMGFKCVMRFFPPVKISNMNINNNSHQSLSWFDVGQLNFLQTC